MHEVIREDLPRRNDIGLLTLQVQNKTILNKVIYYADKEFCLLSIGLNKNTVGCESERLVCLKKKSLVSLRAKKD